MKKTFLIVIVTMLTSLSFAGKESIDLGQTTVHTPVRRTISYKNLNGDAALQIKTVKSSCTCLRVLSYPSEIAAGSSAEIAFELTPDKTGSLDYSLMVLTASGEHQLFELSVDVQSSDGPLSASSIAMPSRVVVPRDSSLYLTSAEIMAQGGFSYVDVRSKTEYRQCHIPGALNVVRSFVFTKSWLKTRPLVLVDGGWGDPALEATARSLRESGFASVHILHGGLAAWRAAGGSTEGILPGLPSLSEVSAADYLQTRGFDDWLVLDVCPTPAAALPESVPFNIPETAEQLKTALSDLTVNGSKRILFVDADGCSGSAAIRRMLAGWSGVSVFYLQDGMAGMEKYQQMMAAAANSRKKTVSSRSQVATASRRSGAGGGIRPRKKGCSSCSH